MDAVIGFLEPINWEKETNNLILVIGNGLTKMIYYKRIKVTIKASGQIEIILDMVVVTTVFQTPL